jgi:S-adenosylmethionine decarboxylase
MDEFGPHLTIDVKNASKEKLSDINLHFEFLMNLPKFIGMTPITQPYVFPYSGLVPEDRGITGFQIIAESHISIHSFEEKGWCFIDIFSCKNFDVDKAIEFTKQIFGDSDTEISLVKRGIGFPRN